MEENINAKIEDYIQDWHWEDEDSKKYAFEICKFLFSFIDYIDQLSVTKRTKTNHKYNVFLIGMFETDYGYNDKFSIKNLENGPDFLYEFERKVSNSKYAIQSYKSTWRKLDKYIKTKEYKKYIKI